MTVRASSRPVRRRFESCGENEDGIESLTLLRSLVYPLAARVWTRVGVVVSGPSTRPCLLFSGCPTRQQRRNHENISKSHASTRIFWPFVVLEKSPKRIEMYRLAHRRTRAMRDMVNLGAIHPTAEPHVPDQKARRRVSLRAAGCRGDSLRTLEMRQRSTHHDRTSHVVFIRDAHCSVVDLHPRPLGGPSRWCRYPGNRWSGLLAHEQVDAVLPLPARDGDLLRRRRTLRQQRSVSSVSIRGRNTEPFADSITSFFVRSSWKSARSGLSGSSASCSDRRCRMSFISARVG